MCCTHWRHALVTGKSRPNWEFVDVLQARKPIDVCDVRARCCWDLGIVLSSNLPCFHEDYLCSSLFQLCKCQPCLFQSLHFMYRNFLLSWILMLAYSASSFCFFSIYSTYLNFVGSKSKHSYQMLSGFFVTQNKFHFKALLAACTESRWVLGGILKIKGCGNGQDIVILRSVFILNEFVVSLKVSWECCLCT